MRWHGEVNGVKIILHDETGFFVEYPDGEMETALLNREGANAIWDWIESLRKEARTDAIREAIEAVIAYADERLYVITVGGKLPAVPVMHESVVAALRVAASRIEALGEQQ